MKDYYQLAAENRFVTLLVGLLLLIAWALLSLVLPTALAVVGMIATGIVVIVFLIQTAVERSESRLKARFRSGMRSVAANVTAEMSNFFYLQDRYPGTGMPVSTYSMTPTNMVEILKAIEERKPQLVIELGSGLSTVMIASYLSRNGQGRVISFDHDERWADRCSKELSDRGLDGIGLVRFAPLRPQRWMERDTLWYDLEPYHSEIGAIDLLVVDGPPRHAGKLARAPALPALYERLNDNSLVALDDGLREAEQEAVRLWRRRYPDLQPELLRSLTGLWLIRCKETPAAHGSGNHTQNPDG